MGHSFEIMILYTVYASKYICKEQQLQTRIQMQTTSKQICGLLMLSVLIKSQKMLLAHGANR